MTSRRRWVGTQYFEVLVFLLRGPPEIDLSLLDQIQGPEIYSRRPGRRGASVFLPWIWLFCIWPRLPGWVSSDANLVIVATFLTGPSILDSCYLSSPGIFSLQPLWPRLEEGRMDLAALVPLQVAAGAVRCLQQPAFVSARLWWGSLPLSSGEKANTEVICLIRTKAMSFRMLLKINNG